jgi:hypothetical protein
LVSRRRSRPLLARALAAWAAAVARTHASAAQRSQQVAALGLAYDSLMRGCNALAAKAARLEAGR